MHKVLGVNVGNWRAIFVICFIESSRYMALGVALRYVLEALRKPPGSKMNMFGTTALDRFKTRLIIIYLLFS